MRKSEKKAQMQPGDQLWPFKFDIRPYLGRRRGYILLRQGLPVLYGASFRPACWLLWPEATRTIVYRPLQNAIVDKQPPFHSPMQKWVKLWAGNSALVRMYLDAVDRDRAEHPEWAPPDGAIE